MSESSSQRKLEKGDKVVEGTGRHTQSETPQANSRPVAQANCSWTIVYPSTGHASIRARVNALGRVYGDSRSSSSLPGSTPCFVLASPFHIGLQRTLGCDGPAMVSPESSGCFGAVDKALDVVWAEEVTFWAGRSEPRNCPL